MASFQSRHHCVIPRTRELLLNVTTTVDVCLITVNHARATNNRPSDVAFRVCSLPFPEVAFPPTGAPADV